MQKKICLKLHNFLKKKTNKSKKSNINFGYIIAYWLILYVEDSCWEKTVKIPLV